VTLSDTTHSCAAEIVTSLKLVANIKTMIASERKKSIRKDPGRWDERLEPKRERDEWICAPVTRSRGRRNTTTGKKQKKKSGPRDTRNEESEGSEEGEGEAGRERQPLCMRGSSPVELEPNPQGEEVIGDEEEFEEWGEEDFDDNLTYHQDSLSIMRGTTSTPLGKDIPIWVTTDTGSMTQLAQSTYVDRMKLKRYPIPRGKGFVINSPGGGQDTIDEYIVIPLKFKSKVETEPEQGFDDCPSEEKEITIKMKFGICDSLRCPYLSYGEEHR
jgi:hypothetical protein